MEERQFTPSEALEMYPKTGILILLKVPKKLRIGLDNTSFEISEKFKGFKLIPPGCHYLHYTQHCTEGEFFWIGEGEVIVKEWSGDDLAGGGLSWNSCQDNEKEERLAQAARNMELDPFLAAYQYQQAGLWKESTLYITKSQVKRMKITVRKPKDIQVGAEYKDQNIKEETQEIKERINNLASSQDNKYRHSKRKPLSKEDFDKRLKELLSSGDQKGASKFVENFEAAEYSRMGALLLKFTDIPKNPKDFYFHSHNKSKSGVVKHVTTHQVTMFYLNKSPVLQFVLKKHFSKRTLEILGEFQMAFIAFMIGQNLEAFDQWKQLFYLITYSKDGIQSDLTTEDKTEEQIEAQKILQFKDVTNGQFWQAVIRCLFSMLKQFPESFFYEILSQGSFIVDCLLALIESVENYINSEPPKFSYLELEKVESICKKFQKDQKRVGTRALALKKLLKDKFAFDLDDALKEEEEGDDAPVMVHNPTEFYQI